MPLLKIDTIKITRKVSAIAIAARPKNLKRRSLLLRSPIFAATRRAASSGDKSPFSLVILLSVFFHDLQGDQIEHEGNGNQCKREGKGR